ncbi:MAG TPA: type II toxin-antitoxin system VapC family toxin [Anaerolineae bacterium]|nr:type II toxin-antitoxin system VapC family toxin [Anaerolineae bacterium]
MNPIVLDTDIWSFLFKGDSRIINYRQYIDNNVLCVSFQTVAELYQWTEIHDWGTKRRTKLHHWLSNFKVLAYDDETAQVWAKIRAVRFEQGRPLAAQDAWVAACALRHQYPLLTHNHSDYALIPDLIIIPQLN